MTPDDRDDPPDDLPWEKLYDQADKVIQKTINSLPEPIRERARAIATLLEKWPPDNDDMLGLYHGFETDRVSQSLGPLFIFLGPIHQMCEDEDIDFENEVRITYLHELGHHLGLDEDDLDERGLS